MDAATLQLISSGVAAYSQVQQGRQAEALARRQAVVAEAEGRRAQDVKAREAGEARRQGRIMKARQITLYAKSGVRAGTGTPLLVSEYTAREAERRAGIISEQGDYAQQYGLSEGRELRASGRAASRAARWRAGSSLLTGASQYGRVRYEYD